MTVSQCQRGSVFKFTSRGGRLGAYFNFHNAPAMLLSFSICSPCHSLTPSFLLQNLTSLQIMDVIVRGAGARGMKVFLDYHRLNAGYEHEWGLWYDANTSETQWINNWLFVVDRYRNDSTVVGVSRQIVQNFVLCRPGPSCLFIAPERRSGKGSLVASRFSLN